MKRKPVVADYFNFSRRERLGLISLCLLILIALLIPHITPQVPPMFADLEDSLWISRVKPDPADENGREPTNAGDVAFDRSLPVRGKLFPFDPNAIGEKEWQQLGIRKRTIATILNFVSKGGRFRKPEDLQKIYGLHQNEFERLRPYIRIPTREESKIVYEKKYSAEKGPRKITSIDINSADTSAFIALPGIGSKLASRIVSFREKLGGFYSIEQIREVYGLQDSVYNKLLPYLSLSAANVKTIDINSASMEMLASHPYIKKEKAALIVSYRKEHGNFGSMEELKRIHGINEGEIEKMRFYLVAQ
jgi:competence ComEA-like helix-hairpin-helix protein